MPTVIPALQNDQFLSKALNLYCNSIIVNTYHALYNNGLAEAKTLYLKPL